MTPRQARIALAAFVLMAAGVVYNALYMQESPAEARVQATPRAAIATPGAKPRAKRTALLKPDSGKSNPAPDALPNAASADTVRAIQRELNQRGFGPVPNDGALRPVTRAAIMAYEHDNRLPLTGEATEALLTRLVLGAPATNGPSATGEAQSPHAEALIRQVQGMLTASGYRPGPVDGRLGAETTAAIRAFEQDQGLTPKGRICAEVVGRLQTSATRLKSADAR